MKKGLLLLLSAFIAAAPLSGTAGASQTVTLEVKNMTCAACPITVKKAIGKVPGVANATVDYDTRSAVVTFDPSKTSVEAITRATAEAGYPSSVKR